MTVTHHSRCFCFWSYINGPCFSVFHSLHSDTGEENVALFLNVFAVDWISLGNSNVFINLMVNRRLALPKGQVCKYVNLGLPVFQDWQQWYGINDVCQWSQNVYWLSITQTLVIWILPYKPILKIRSIKLNIPCYHFSMRITIKYSSCNKYRCF